MTAVGASANAGRALEIAIAAQLACLLEVGAPKPGNVSPAHDFADLRYEDFLASAIAFGTALSGAATRSIGETVRLAIEASAQHTRSNTNLGIVLLISPLTRAALAAEPSGPIPPDTLRHALRRVLAATTVDDARDVYAAIRRAAPGGLGRADQQDVADEPTMTLLEVMRLAADRDGVAREYATAFEATFEKGAPTLARARRDGLPWNDAIVETFLAILAAAPDTHIVRRGGTALATDVSRRAGKVLAAGGVRSESGRIALRDMHRALQDPSHLTNPGTSADITAAAIFVVLLSSDRLKT